MIWCDQYREHGSREHRELTAPTPFFNAKDAKNTKFSYWKKFFRGFRAFALKLGGWGGRFLVPDC